MGIRYITNMVVNIDPLADDINKQSTTDNSFTHDVSSLVERHAYHINHLRLSTCRQLSNSRI